MENKRVLYVRGYRKLISEEEYRKLIKSSERPNKKDGKSS
jgi:hypothetical protein